MDATPLNLARPEVPVELAALVAKMMAKEPERRFQEPKQVAQALMPFFKKGTHGSVRSKPEVSQAGQTNAGRSVSTADSSGDGRRKRGRPGRGSGEADRAAVEEPGRFAAAGEGIRSRSTA